MARQLQWIETAMVFEALADQGGIELITKEDMDELRACTVERIIMTRILKNGTTSPNRVYEGVIVQPDESTFPAYLDVKANDNANRGWLWKQMTPLNAADQSMKDVNGLPNTFDLRTRRKMRVGESLVYLCDDINDDYDMVGLHARILVRLG